METNWIKYSISSKGSISKDHYILLKDAKTWEDDDIKNIIVHRYESWAQYAEYYRIEFDRNVLPPVEIIDKELIELYDRIESLRTTRENLMEFRIEHYGFRIEDDDIVEFPVKKD